MKLTVPHDALLQLARDAARAADAKAFDRTRDVLLMADGAEFGAATVTPSLSVLGSTVATVERAGQAVVGAHAFAAMVARLTAGVKGVVSVERLANHHVELRRGKRTLVLPGMPAKAFGALPLRPGAGVWQSLPVGTLALAIRAVAHAVPAPEQRPAMAGVRVEAGDGVLAAFATDGARAACHTVAYRGEPFAATVPWRLAGLIRAGVFGKAKDGDTVGKVRYLDDDDGAETSLDDDARAALECAITERGVWVRRAGDSALAAGSAQLAGEYPAWRSLDGYRERMVHSAVVERVELMAAATALCALDVMNAEQRDAVRLDLQPGALSLRASSRNDTTGSDVVAAADENIAFGPTAFVWVNARFLRDALKSLEPANRVRIRLGAADCPVRLEAVPDGDEPDRGAGVWPASWTLIMPLDAERQG